MSLFTPIKHCRISKKKDLINIAKFPLMGLTGTFPVSKKTKIIKTPLEIVFSKNSKLLQLKHNYKPEILYGENYGYRSGLNPVMINHLRKKADFLKTKIKKKSQILDIGANDGTFLNFFNNKYNTFAIDPTLKKFGKFHKNTNRKISETFLKGIKKIRSKKFDLITAIAMFYDLEDPEKNLKKIRNILNYNGVFHMEVAYLPTIIKNFSYDTFCQEHYEYYSLISLKNLIEKVNMKIDDFGFNSINGGSIWLNIKNNKVNHCKKLNKYIDLEYKEKIHLPQTYIKYFKKVFKHASSLKKTIQKLKKRNNLIYGYGASTKGNVLLQLAKLNAKEITKIVDVNPYKFGRITPVSNIEIAKEKELNSKKIKYVLLLIWHLKNHSLKKIKNINKKLKIIIPFPKIKIL